ncbi:MAG: hypothetical protein K1060chlam5_01299 [Candidatus Anoxychlamydiales bacterium]|nr:hypothetical protein [Candidatus Anoxychlamydiales bacterium]
MSGMSIQGFRPDVDRIREPNHEGNSELCGMAATTALCAAKLISYMSVPQLCCLGCALGGIVGLKALEQCDRNRELKEAKEQSEERRKVEEHLEFPYGDRKDGFFPIDFNILELSHLPDSKKLAILREKLTIVRWDSHSFNIFTDIYIKRQLAMHLVSEIYSSGLDKITSQNFKFILNKIITAIAYQDNLDKFQITGADNSFTLKQPLKRIEFNREVYQENQLKRFVEEQFKGEQKILYLEINNNIYVIKKTPEGKYWFYNVNGNYSIKEASKNIYINKYSDIEGVCGHLNDIERDIREIAYSECVLKDKKF